MQHVTLTISHRNDLFWFGSQRELDVLTVASALGCICFKQVSVKAGHVLTTYVLVAHFRAVPNSF